VSASEVSARALMLAILPEDSGFKHR
jgi:hypothetical protein